MRLLTRQEQNYVYQHFVEIIKVLAVTDGAPATDAIRHVYLAAQLIGGKEMEEALGGKRSDTSNKDNTTRVR